MNKYQLVTLNGLTAIVYTKNDELFTILLNADDDQLDNLADMLNSTEYSHGKTITDNVILDFDSAVELLMSHLYTKDEVF